MGGAVGFGNFGVLRRLRMPQAASPFFHRKRASSAVSSGESISRFELTDGSVAGHRGPCRGAGISALLAPWQQGE